MHPDDLERWADDELRQLPTPRAPHTLLTRVMAAIARAPVQPWYARPWFAWPIGWQIVSVAALLLFGGLAFDAVSVAQSTAWNAPPQLLSRMAADVTVALGYLQAATTAIGTIWRAIGEPVGPYAFALVATMCIASAGLVAALNQIVVGRGFHQ